MDMDNIMQSSPQSKHLLYDKWVFWAHLPHDTDWTLNSYKKITKLDSVESVLSLIEYVPEKMIQNCMFHPLQ